MSYDKKIASFFAIWRQRLHVEHGWIIGAHAKNKIYIYDILLAPTPKTKVSHMSLGKALVRDGFIGAFFKKS